MREGLSSILPKSGILMIRKLSGKIWVRDSGEKSDTVS